MKSQFSKKVTSPKFAISQRLSKDSPPQNLSKGKSVAQFNNTGKLKPVLSKKEEIFKQIHVRKPKETLSFDQSKKSGGAKKQTFAYQEKSQSEINIKNKKPVQKVTLEDNIQHERAQDELDENVIFVKQDKGIFNRDSYSPNQKSYQNYPPQSSPNKRETGVTDIPTYDDGQGRGSTSSFTVFEERKSPLLVNIHQQKLQQYMSPNPKTTNGEIDKLDSSGKKQQNLDYKRFIEEDEQNLAQQKLRVDKKQNEQSKPISNESSIRQEYNLEEQEDRIKRPLFESKSLFDTRKDEHQYKLNDNSEISYSADNGSKYQTFQSPAKNYGSPNQKKIQDKQAQQIQQDNVFQTPYGEQQQQRLEDILQSKGDLTQLQSALQSQKIDEKSLNNMIDMEKNYVIMQYENILQQLNIEFHKMLNKSKEQEEIVIQKEGIIQTQARLLQEKEETLFSQEQQQRNQRSQIQDLKQELDYANSQTQRHMQSDQDNFKVEREIHESQVNNLKNNIKIYQQQEEDQRQQIDVIQGKLRQTEALVREKDESIYQLQKDIQTLQRDLKNLGDVETQLKSELSQQNSVRLQLEDHIQELKQQMLQQQLQQRQKDIEVESLVRENRAHKGTLEIIQDNINDVMNENDKLKEGITESEKQRLQMRSLLEKQERQIIKLQQEMKRAQVLFDQEQMQRLNLETQIRASTPTPELQQNNSPFDKNQYQVVKQTYQSPQKSPYQYLPSKLPTFKEQQSIASFQSQQSSQNEYINQPSSYFSRPSQDFNMTYPSPKKDQQYKIKVNDQEQQQPPSTIQWTSYKNNPLIQIPQQQNTQMQSQRKQYEEQQQMKRNIKNQNESQLNDIFQWPSQSNQGAQRFNQTQGGSSRSLDRDYGHRFQGNDLGIQKSNTLQTQSQLQQQNDSMNFELQAAGKKSTIQSSPMIVKNKNTEQLITHLQNSLSSMQMEKERIENDLRRVGQHLRNKQQIEKKQELENEVEIVNRNVQNLKQKLRELNAF